MNTRYRRLDALAFGGAAACTALIMALFVALPMAGMRGYGAMGWGGHMGGGAGHMGWGIVPFGGAFLGWIGGAIVIGLLAVVFAAIYNGISAATARVRRVDPEPDAPPAR